MFNKSDSTRKGPFKAVPERLLGKAEGGEVEPRPSAASCPQCGYAFGGEVEEEEGDEGYDFEPQDEDLQESEDERRAARKSAFADALKRRK